MSIKEIGLVSNYYGGLAVKRENGLCYWSIENWDGYDFWELIPESLYDALCGFEDARIKE